VIFHFFGHSNVSGTHYNTLEFTKDLNLTKEGDCIIGVKADFDSKHLKEIIQKYSDLKITITVGEHKDEIFAKVNKWFDDDSEIVIRKSSYSSKRSLGINADKSAKDINRDIIEKLKNPDTKGSVEVIGL